MSIHVRCPRLHRGRVQAERRVMRPRDSHWRALRRLFWCNGTFAPLLRGCDRCRHCGKDGSIRAIQAKSSPGRSPYTIGTILLERLRRWTGVPTTVGAMKPYVLMLLIGTIVAFSDLVRCGQSTRRRSSRARAVGDAARNIVRMHTQRRLP